MILFVFGTQSECLEINNKMWIPQGSCDHQRESHLQWWQMA